MLVDGDTKHINSIYTRYAPRLLAFAEKFVNPYVAEDLVHDVFLRFWDRGVFYLPEEDISKLLFVSVRNACVDLLRKQTNQIDLLSARDIQLTLDELDFHHSSEEKFMREDLLSLLMKEAENLPEKTRAVFKMFYQEGLKAAEIAEKTGVSLRTVENQLYRAMTHLRQKCGRYLYLFLLLP